MPGDIMQRLEKLVRPREQWTPVDEAVYGVKYPFLVETEKAEQLRFTALKYSFNHHYENNAFYHRLCQHEGVAPSDIKDPSDLFKIPLIPDTFFKDYPAGVEFYEWLQKIATGKLPSIKFRNSKPSYEDVIAALAQHNYTITYTSGSSGRFSFFPRDELTWMRQRYNLASAFAEMLKYDYENGDPENMVWLSGFSNPYKTNLFTGKLSLAVIGTLVDPQNVKYLLDMKVTTDSLRISRGGAKGIKEKIIARIAKSARKTLVPKFIKLIETYSKQGKQLIIVSAPFFVESLLSTLEAKGEKFELKNAWLITGGGWKLPTGGAILGDQWRKRVEMFLGIPPERCRDGYGMSESSAFHPDCEGHYKHVPHSYEYPFVLDDELKPVKEGDVGRLAFLDAAANSYPGFIITGDKVKMLKKCPVCNRPGPVIDSDISRIGGVESRGCSEIAGLLMSQELQKATK